MVSTIIQMRFGEGKNPLGRFVLDRGRVLGISRTELVHRLGYHQIGKGHRKFSEALTTGEIPPQIGANLPAALQVEEELVSAADRLDGLTAEA